MPRNDKKEIDPLIEKPVDTREFIVKLLESENPQDILKSLNFIELEELEIAILNYENEINIASHKKTQEIINLIFKLIRDRQEFLENCPPIVADLFNTFEGKSINQILNLGIAMQQLKNQITNLYGEENYQKIEDNFFQELEEYKKKNPFLETCIKIANLFESRELSKDLENKNFKELVDLKKQIQSHKKEIIDLYGGKTYRGIEKDFFEALESNKDSSKIPPVVFELFESENLSKTLEKKNIKALMELKKQVQNHKEEIIKSFGNNDYQKIEKDVFEVLESNKNSSKIPSVVFELFEGYTNREKKNAADELIKVLQNPNMNIDKKIQKIFEQGRLGKLAKAFMPVPETPKPEESSKPSPK